MLTHHLRENSRTNLRTDVCVLNSSSSFFASLGSEFKASSINSRFAVCDASSLNENSLN